MSSTGQTIPQGGDMYINIPSDLGGLIRSARKVRGWNQAYLASLVGIHQPDLSDIERDPKKANFGLLLKICAALQLKLLVNDLSGKQSGARVVTRSQSKSTEHTTVKTTGHCPIKAKDASTIQETWTSKSGNKVNF